MSEEKDIWVSCVNEEMTIVKSQELADSISDKLPFVVWVKITIDKKSYDSLPAEANVQDLRKKYGC